MFSWSNVSCNLEFDCVVFFKSIDSVIQGDWWHQCLVKYSAQVTSLQQDASGTQLLLPSKFLPQTTFPKTLEKAIYWAHPRGHDEHDVLLRDGKVMNEGEFLQRHFGALKQLARRGATVNLNGLRYTDGQPDVEEFPRGGVPLGMSREEGNATLRDAPILEEILPQGFQGTRVQAVGKATFTKCQQTISPPQHAGVGRVGC
mmetsp:Transcript_52851/g.115323  ORF Transcript_52851/g.115323 Transcript_52851/m.115323 type:complete len:201 (-) Transcript_52851:510-1112(-)